jgi:hypothetical protein
MAGTEVLYEGTQQNVFWLSNKTSGGKGMEIPEIFNKK